MWLSEFMHICESRMYQNVDLFIDSRAFARIKVLEGRLRRAKISKVKTFATTTACLSIGVGKLKSASNHFV